MASSLSHVATLICNPATPALTDAAVARAKAALGVAGVARWLAPEIAADIPFAPAASLDDPALLDALRDALDGAPADIVLQQASGRRKKLFVADMDSTIIGQECIDELADLVGLKDHVSKITERAMRGEIAFEPALRERVALLAGLDSSVVADVIHSRITLTAGAKTLVGTMRKHGAYTALVSGGFTAFTQTIADMVGFDENRANKLVVENHKFVGRVVDPILGSDAKLSALVELRARRKLTPEETMAAGDGANDLAMLLEAGLGVAYHAKPAVAAAAHARIDHGDLTALLYIQGYSRDDFVA